MAKSRSFSIYLLKIGFSAENALRHDHELRDDVDAKNLPTGAVLYILDRPGQPPWWRSYFGIEVELWQVHKGAVVFVPVQDRCFVLCFGHVSHSLLETSYEYDFGLRVTLNSLDPRKLKSTDTLEPGEAKRQRTQLPVESELTLFDFDRDSTILRTLTGKVREEHKELFRHATGGSNLRISSDVTPEGVPALCEKLLALYQSDQYKQNFPEIQNIVPVRDPVRIEALNGKLLEALRARDPDLNITVPEIINYSDNLFVRYSGAGHGLIYDDVYIGRYYEYLEKNGVDFGALTVEDLRNHALLLTDEEGVARDRYSIFKSLVFDTTIAGAEQETFHICEGNWYRFDNDYIARLCAYLDPLWEESPLPPYAHPSEGEYNKSVPASIPDVACLDTENISPEGQTAVEPCDLIGEVAGKAVFYHVKVSTLSAQLSHLFNQGVNAIELLRSEPESIEKLVELIRGKLSLDAAASLTARIQNQQYRVVFGIVTRKAPERRSLNLPLFSRISLMRKMKALRIRDVSASYCFIADQTGGAEGRKKTRKRKAAELEAVTA